MLKGCLSFRNLLNTIHDKIYHSTKKTKLSKAKVFTQIFGTFFTRSAFGDEKFVFKVSGKTPK